MRTASYAVCAWLATMASGCPEAQDVYVQDDLSELDGMDDEELEYIRELLEYSADSPGWPPYPRRVGSITTDQKNETTLSAGVKGSFFELVEAEATGSIILGLGQRENLLLIKTSDGGLSPLTRETDGVVYLNYEKGVEYVGMCTYAAYINAGARFVGKMTVSGNGVTNQTDLTNATEVYQSTNFFRIREGDTVDLLLARCAAAFDRRIRHSVAVDLKNLAISQVRIDADEVDQLYQALQGALYGPARERLFALGHHWNVHPASWVRLDRDEQRFRISGRLWRNIQILSDSPVDYEFEFADGEMVSEWISVDDSGSWQQAARELARLIANEAYLEFRVGLDTIDPGAPLRATLYADPEFGGAAVELGVGHYNTAYLEQLGLSNDTLSSLRIPAGLRVRAFRDEDLDGDQWALTGDTAELGSTNDEISSVVVEVDPDVVSDYTVTASGTNGSLASDGGAVVAGPSGARWGLEHVEAGYYRLVNRAAGGYVGVKAASKDAGARAKLVDDGDATEAHWALVRVPDTQDEQYQLVNRNSGMALALGNGGEVVQRDVGDDPAQRWVFE